jgi:alkylation response protein AidB-like acyl-CoA dehydrogenase
MDFDMPPADDPRRLAVRDWIAGHPEPSNAELHGAGYVVPHWPSPWGLDADPIHQLIIDAELRAAGVRRTPVSTNPIGVGWAAPTIHLAGSDWQRQRFLDPIFRGDEYWCQMFSEPDSGSDLASLATRAVRDGDEYVLNGSKIWTSGGHHAQFGILIARTDPDVPKHKGLSAFVVSMDQPGIEQRPLRMINGITTEFGEVLFDGARVPAANMIGELGDGWRLAMTIVSHEREPGELGYVARYSKAVNQLAARVRSEPNRYGPGQVRELGWAMIEAEMLRLHVCRRLSDRLDGISHGPEGSVDKLLMTSVEQAVGHAALAIGGAGHAGDDTWLRQYLYSRAQSVMGGTSQIQRNLVATRILGLPTS